MHDVVFMHYTRSKLDTICPIWGSGKRRWGGGAEALAAGRAEAKASATALIDALCVIRDHEKQHQDQMRIPTSADADYGMTPRWESGVLRFAGGICTPWRGSKRQVQLRIPSPPVGGLWDGTAVGGRRRGDDAAAGKSRGVFPESGPNLHKPGGGGKSLDSMEAAGIFLQTSSIGFLHGYPPQPDRL